MPNAKNIDTSNMFVKGLIKGDPKSGKTTFVGTWPDPFFFVFDNGIKSLIGQDVNYKEYSDHDVTHPTAFVDAQNDLHAAMKSASVNGKVIYDEAKDCFVTGKVQEIKAPLKHIKTMCIDCGTPFMELIMNYTQSLRSTAGATPSENDWYPQMHTFSKFMDKALALPCHVWLTTYEKIKEIKAGRGRDATTIATRLLPNLTGSLGTCWGGKVDCIFRARVKQVSGKTHYDLQSQFQGLYEAGHRFGNAFDLFIDPPTYEEVMRNIDKYLKKKMEVRERLVEEAKELDKQAAKQTR